MKDFYQQLAKLTPEQRAIFEKKLEQKGLKNPVADTAVQTISRRPSDENLPLSFAQQRLWFVQQLDPSNAAYNMMGVLKLSGPLKPEVLKNSITAVAQRHETLRTSFSLNADNEAIQIIHPEPMVDFEDHDLTTLQNPEEKQQHAHTLVEHVAFAPYDLSRPQLRASLINMGQEDGKDCHLLALGTHHITSDRWSFTVFVKELGILYRAIDQQQASPLPDNKIQYADWALWQRNELQGEKLDKQLNYWCEKLQAPRAVIEVPTDNPRQQLASYKGAQLPVKLSSELSEKLRNLANEQQLTLFTLLLAAFKVLMHRYTTLDDIIVGSEVANRDRVETQSMMGPLVNTLVLRTDMAGNPSFRQLLTRVNNTVKTGLSHQDVPFEKLVETLNPERQLSQMSPLFQVKFDLQHANLKPFELDGLTLERYPLKDKSTKYELRFNLQDLSEHIGGQIEYAQDLYQQSTIERLLGHYISLLEAIATNPDQSIGSLPLLTKPEQQCIHSQWNNTTVAVDQQSTVHQLIEQQAAKTPNAIAIQQGTHSLSYQTLNQRANQLAAQLQSQGLGNGDRAGICLPASSEALIAILAVIKTGAAYVPMDINYPTERLRFMAQDAGLTLLLTHRTRCADFADCCTVIDSQAPLAPEFLSATDNLKHTIDAEQLLYVVYTSGSTGQPKGAGVRHRNAVNLLSWYTSAYHMDANDSHLVISALGFDLTQKNLFALLTVGGTVVFSEREHYDPADIVQHIETQNISLLNCAPSAFYPLLEACADKGYAPLNSLRTVLLGGEALVLNKLQPWFNQCATQLVNMYGPTECTDIAATHTLDKAHLSQGQQRIPIGQPNANVQLYVLDERYQQSLPVGVPGGLYIGGLGVGAGYLNQAALNEAAFIDNPFGPGKLYRSGDWVRRLPNGDIDFISRIDGQLKLRGFRIEAGEIEQQLAQQNNIKEAVVAIRNLEALNGDALTAYIVLEDSHQPTDQQHWRDQLSKQLPDYMVPTVFVVIPQWPLSANGKIDHKALPQPTAEHLCFEETVAPSTDTEHRLVDIWTEELSSKGITLPTLGVNHNFFAIGGHSLLAIQIIARTESAFNVSLGLRDFFQAPTIAQVAQFIDQQLIEGHQGAGTVCNDRPPITVDPEGQYQPFPLTDIQHAYWLGRNRAFELGNIGTHGYREFDVEGVTAETLERALQALIARHPMLRATINPQGMQQVMAQAPHYAIQTLDVSQQSDTEREPALLAVRERLSHQLFDPAQWPLFQIEAAKLSDTKQRFFVSFDVLIGDAWSFQLLGREIAQLAAGIKLPPLDLNFRDYVLADQAFTSSERYQADYQYWLDRLDQLPPAPDLPLTKAPSQIEEPTFTRRTATLCSQDWERLKQRATEARLTPSGLILAAFAEVLNRWSRKPHFTLNLTLFNRYPLHPQVNDIVGDFTASMLLGVDQSGHGSFISRAQRLQDQLWVDLDHRSVSGVQVLRELARKQNRATSALMPVVFTSTLGQESQTELSGAGLKAERVFNVSQTSQVYLDHQVGEVDGELLFNWDAIDELFPEGLLDEMFNRYCDFLQRLIHEDQSWQQYPALMDAKHFDTLNVAEANTLTITDQLLHEGFFEQAAKTPEQIAIFSEERTLSYSELAHTVIDLSEQIRAQGVAPNQLIAVSLSKGWRQVAACLAILSAGAAYVPIDPKLPQARRWQLLEDTQSPLLISDHDDWPETIPRLNVTLSDAKGPWQQPARSQRATDLAYVIFTSGSTGKPKGVMIDHRGAVNTIKDINQRFAIGPEDRVFALSSLSFDLSVYDLFGPLAVGGAIVMPNDEQVENTAHWRPLLANFQVSVWNTVPALMQLLVSEISGDPCPVLAEQLRCVMMSGDWIPLSLPPAINHLFPKAAVYSLGGATEASIWSIYYPIDRVEPQWRSIPYGRPLANQRWYVLDDNLNPCPPWVPGQLYIGGIGVAKGYWNRQSLTAERFIADPFVEQDADTVAYLYNTGDVGRYCPGDPQASHPAGTLEFLGRDDFQVKINGYRIELGEIESVLIQHDAVEAAVVHTVGTPLQVMAYLVLKPNHGDDQDSLLAILQAYLREQLPAYMLPKQVMVIEDIPLTANGKVDRKALPSPNQETLARQIVPPKTDDERTLIDTWQTLLDHSPISMDDNFFEVGGNSLAAMRILTQLQQQFEVELTIGMIFNALTPAEQMLMIEQQRQSQSSNQHIEAVSREVVVDEAELDDALEAALSDNDVDDMLAQLLAEES